MTKNLFKYGILSCTFILHTACMADNYISASTPCGNPLDYYNELSVQTDKELSPTEAHALPAGDDTHACFKLQEAIRLSMPGSKQQNDIQALILLNDLKLSGILSKSDQQFNDMLLQHVSQRQDLRNMIGSQDEQLKKTETQIDQLKDIEVEIDKKERSVASPIDE
jgi:hypothetical protein